ncbi:elongation factor G [Nonomuraea harbinensis]|uniref:GTP-binding protein n=1 Tax=Nonomuraea harbinensis TaxID=1286938 RepID=A0ABW1BMA8_9ACTN|nr:TetM/TetW/TetO/TetS family tetracycline resistance ribosomal protection protein [Nonomuraea harbinensis]
MKTLNLGILAHVDAGKTSLTERLLHAAGVIDELGSVDQGSTRTDTLALERRRGITIRSAVVSFPIGDVTVNLIDTPGHPDFIAEVERVLDVLDGAVLAVSAVEGVQAQTRVLMRTLRRLGIPALIFVNKIDRRGAAYGEVLDAIRARLAPSGVAMSAVTGLGTRAAAVTPAADPRLAELLADHDETLLAAYVDDRPITDRRLRQALTRQARDGLAHPVFFGSAITGAGVPALMDGIRDLLPAAEGDASGPPSGAVFKVERGPAGERLAYVRMFSGTLRVRDTVPGHGKVTAIGVFDRGTAVRADAVGAGRIGLLSGLGGIRVGDYIGDQLADQHADHAADHVMDHHADRVADRVGIRVGPARGRVRRHFAPPSLETVVTPVRAADRGALHAALTQLAEQDPLIGLRQDDVRQETYVSLYGEVQKEVIQQTLAEEFGLDVTFEETTTICVERPAGTGAAAEFIAQGGNPFLGTVGLRVEPGPIGSGVTFRLAVELGSMPYTFMRAVEETARQTLQQGLHGWEVIDCAVTLTHTGYWARQSHSHGVFDKSMSSTAGDFRNLTPLVLMDALKQAGTRVHEPLHRFHLEIPADLLGGVLPVLSRLRAVPTGSRPHGDTYRIEGTVPAALVHGLERALPSLTRGEGVLETAFDRYQRVPGPPPARRRIGHDPRNRKEYLLHVVRMV